jgi:PIN domain nuclease of toxin-antitoxin system
MALLPLNPIAIWEMRIFVEGGKLENPVKNSPSIGENQQNSSGPQW